MLVATEQKKIDQTIEALGELSYMVAQDLKTISRKFDQLKNIFTHFLQEHELEKYFRNLTLIFQAAFRKKNKFKIINMMPRVDTKISETITKKILTNI